MPGLANAGFRLAWPWLGPGLAPWLGLARLGLARLGLAWLGSAPAWLGSALPMAAPVAEKLSKLLPATQFISHCKTSRFSEREHNSL